MYDRFVDAAKVLLSRLLRCACNVVSDVVLFVDCGLEVVVVNDVSKIKKEAMLVYQKN